MKNRIGPILLSVTLVSTATASALAGVTEPQTPVQSAPPLSAVPAQPSKPAWLTPEKEPALIEVRKILKEAWEVVTRTVPPTKPPGTTTPENRQTDLERYKGKLLTEIEKARFRAGDFATASTTKEHWELALAQLRYGHFQEAVQTILRGRVSFTEEALAAMKLLSDAGDLTGAREVAQAQVAKEPVDQKRHQIQAELLAYLARRQAKMSELVAHETLSQAVEALKANDRYPTFQYAGWAAIGCSQAAMHDEAGATESFRKAMEAIRALSRTSHEGEKAALMAFIGRAAAQSGLKVFSHDAFDASSRLASSIADPRSHVVAIAHRAVMQIRSGDRLAGLQTFQEALKFTEGLSSGQQLRTALGDIVEHQLMVNEYEAAEVTLERLRYRVKTSTDPKEKEADQATIRHWEAKFEPPLIALERAYGIESDPEPTASRLGYVVFRLIHSKEPVMTPEVVERLSRTAEALLAKPLPNDREKADRYLSNLALVQAVVSGASAALQTASRITDQRSQKQLYLNLVFLLAHKRDVGEAKQVLDMLSIPDKELLWGSSGMTRGDAFREVAKAQAISGHLPETLAWTRQENSLYRKGEILFGAALGVMEQKAIPDLRDDLPMIDKLGKGRIDKLAISCAPL
jgi:hypothetical protein